MSTLYIDTNPDAPEGFGAFDDDEFRPLFSDAEIDAYERRRDAERVEFECKMKHHKTQDKRMRKLKPVEI